MAIIQEVGYSIKRGQEEAYPKWIEDNGPSGTARERPFSCVDQW